MHKHTYGFTVIELLIVIIVIAILAVISTIVYNGVQSRAYVVRMQADVQSIERAIELYKVDHGQWPHCAAGGELACLMTEIAPQLETKGVPIYTGRSGSMLIHYVAETDKDRWAVRLQRLDGTYCKAGRNMRPTWWSNAPLCW